MNEGPILLCALAMCGCAGPRPAPPSTATVVAPASWRNDSDAADTLDGRWWWAFGDPSLAAVVEGALANNTDIAIAVTRVEEARAQFRIAHSRLLPTIEVVGEGSRDRTVDPFLQGFTQTDGSAELSTSYDVDLFGRLSQATAAARASLLASAAARDTVRVAIASAAAQGYVTLLALDTQLAIVRDTLKARADSLQVARRQEAAGYSSTLELRQAESEYYSTAQLIPAIELAIRRQEDGLSVLLGDNPGPIQRGASLDDLLLPAVPLALPASLLRRRPDLMQAEELLVAADHSLDAARADFLPRIDLTASAGRAYSDIFAAPINIYAFSGGILAPLFEGGRLRAQADAAAAERDQAAFRYRKTALTAFGEVEDALAAVQHNDEQERAISLQREALARTLTLATNRYRSGYSPYLEQLDAQRELLSADLALAQTRANRLGAIIELYRSLGGGWQPEGDLADAGLRLQHRVTSGDDRTRSWNVHP